MFKWTASKGKVNVGLTVGALLGAAIPIVAVAATGGVAAVPMTLWLGLGGTVSALFAGNVEPKSPVERVIDEQIARAGRDDG